MPFFDEIAQDILKRSDCVIWYLNPEEETPDPQDLLPDLSQMQLFVIPVTSRFLCEPNPARETEFPFAMDNHIPVLPLMQENGLESLFNETCGDLQTLNKHAGDATAIDFEEKLDRFLSDVLIGDDLAQKIRAAFDAYVFLSYRKKDRRYAQQLMRLIHKNDFCRDIAIWYDEFLVPGENFNDAIAAALEKSSLFALAVTPNMVNEPNYVMRIEYPMAKEQEKTILPCEVVPTDPEALKQTFPDLPSCADAHDPQALSSALLQAVRSLAIRENNSSPEHNFFIGLAYLSGIDVEVDYERARRLISGAARENLPEAIEKMTDIYRNGIGVRRDYRAAAKWKQRLVELRKKTWQESGRSSARLMLLFDLLELAELYLDLGENDAAFSLLSEAGTLKEQEKDIQNTPDWQQLSSLAFICHHLGICLLKKDEFHRAREQFEIALRYHQALLDSSRKLSLPDAHLPLIRRRMSADHYYLGQLLQKTGPTEEAARHINAGIALCREQEKTSEDAVLLLAQGYLLRGDLFLSAEQTEKALSDYEKGLSLCKNLYETTASERYRLTLCAAYSRPVVACISANRLAEAQRYLDESFSCLPSSISDLHTLEEHRLVSSAYHNLGALENKKGNLPAAERAFLRAIEVLEHLPPQIQENIQILRAINGNRMFLIRLAEKQSRIPQAIARCQEQISLLETLSQKTGQPSDLRSLSVAYTQLAGLYRKETLLSSAEAYYRKGVVLQEQLCQGNATLRARTDLCRSSYNYAYCLQELGDADAARQRYLQCAGLAEQLAQESPTPEHLDDLAQAYYQLGVHAEEYGLEEYADTFLSRAEELRKALKS